MLAASVSSGVDFSASNGRDVKIKKTYRKRKGSEKAGTAAAAEKAAAVGNPGSKKLPRRKSTATVPSDSDADSHEDHADDHGDLDEADRSQQHLRSWIDQVSI
jgi:hypothetical protein